MAVAYTEIEDTFYEPVARRPQYVVQEQPKKFQIEGIHFIVVYLFMLLIMTIS